MGIPPSTASRLLWRNNRIARLRLAQEVRRAGLLRSSRAPSCDFASQSSSLRSSGNLTASPQVHPALTRPDACGAGASRDGHSLHLHSPAADPSRVHLFDRFSRDRQCRAGGSHIIPDRTRIAQDTPIRPQAANVQNGSTTSAQSAAGPERHAINLGDVVLLERPYSTKGTLKWGEQFKP